MRLAKLHTTVASTTAPPLPSIPGGQRLSDYLLQLPADLATARQQRLVSSKINNPSAQTISPDSEDSDNTSIQHERTRAANLTLIQMLPSQSDRTYWQARGGRILPGTIDSTACTSPLDQRDPLLTRPMTPAQPDDSWRIAIY